MFENRQKFLKIELCNEFLTYISKRGKKRKIFNNANEAAEISFTIVLSEEYEHAICGIGVMV